MNETTALRANVSLYRLIGIIVAGALLNIGFYFILFILTPIFSGFIVGYLLGRIKEGAIAGFGSSFIAFLPLLFYLAPLLMPQTPSADVGFYIAIIFSVLFFSFIGMVGGIIGSLIHMRTRSH